MICALILQRTQMQQAKIINTELCLHISYISKRKLNGLKMKNLVIKVRNHLERSVLNMFKRLKQNITVVMWMKV